ncbi:hypothetical protein C1Y63_04830 [Corynebacterium sp. 13CS0277]|uniref:hypothetical protein n=1 Tax=Corynebacterium sp. 13CS0277 TaxID=2071994 RepID=UPI000D02F59E|nr:hypothetical protein [Corynebacterium sp. 13CS0277]PRQ11736.1 hypothetical protein C1Y63_04830 [Corynebacterium sp. 13CS0277]
MQLPGGRTIVYAHDVTMPSLLGPQETTATVVLCDDGTYGALINTGCRGCEYVPISPRMIACLHDLMGAIHARTEQDHPQA